MLVIAQKADKIYNRIRKHRMTKIRKTGERGGRAAIYQTVSSPAAQASTNVKRKYKHNEKRFILIPARDFLSAARSRDLLRQLYGNRMTTRVEAT